MGYEVMLDHSNEAGMMYGYIPGMLCKAQSSFCGTVMAKGIPIGYIIDEIAACA